MNHQTIRRGGKTYVLVEQGEFDKLVGGLRVPPPLIRAAPAGTTDAVQFARATIARNIIDRREAAGMTQTDLARAAGVRVETLSRIENAHHTADVATLAKIDAALPAEGVAGGGSAKGSKDGAKGFGFRGPSALAVRSKSTVTTGTAKRYVRRDTKGGLGAVQDNRASRGTNRTRKK